MNKIENSELRIGISSCLLGNEVRFDGGHKHDHYIRKFNEPYLKTQYYLNPHPLELKLRNHA